MNFRNLDRCIHYRMLKDLAGRELDRFQSLRAETVQASNIPIGGGLTFNYAARGVSGEGLALLEKLANEQELLPKYRALVSGELMNPGEKRRVLHHLLRSQLGNPVVVDGQNLREFYIEQQEKIAEFCAQVHGKKRLGATGQPFDTVVQIGIGGSDLGPRALYLGLENLFFPKLRAFFISNVDPDDANAVLSRINPETSLFIVVSKSGTTQETLTNETLVRRWLEASIGDNPDLSRHMVAVTGVSSPMAESPVYSETFYIDDYIGGRYSATSAVGGVLLSLAFGIGVFREILDGAAEADKLALEKTSLEENAPMMDAMLGVWERNILNYSAVAVLPYSQALLRFPAHLQQLDMESNGKQVNRNGQAISYMTGPIVFGEPGTNGQHSFYQMLHQGTSPVPLQFIGFSSPQIVRDFEVESGSQKKLEANLCAQIAAFAEGRQDANLNKNFPGRRPSSLIYGKQLTPRSLGALLAHYENKIMFQGFVWNINSFDQEGVQLGKVLTDKILNGQASPTLQAYMNLFGN